MFTLSTIQIGNLAVRIGSGGAGMMALLSAVPVIAGGLPQCDRTGAPDYSSAICRKMGDLGQFETARRGPRIAGHPTIEILYADSRGSNIREQSVALLMVEQDQAQILWMHKALDLSSRPLVPIDHAIVYHWRYGSGGHTIRVTGTLTLGAIDNMWSGLAHGSRTRLASERYCYVEDLMRFNRC